jgi:hypothetical protein
MSQYTVRGPGSLVPTDGNRTAPLMRRPCKTSGTSAGDATCP